MAKGKVMAAPFQPLFGSTYQTTLDFSVAKRRVESKDSTIFTAITHPLPPTPAVAATATAGADAENPQSLLEQLPLEMTQEVAHYLTNDQDVENFRLSCKTVNSAVDDSHYYFWRTRFITKYGKPRVDSRVRRGQDFKIAYRQRRHVLVHATKFKLGSEKREQDCLQVLKDIILDSHSGVNEENELVYKSNLEEILKTFCYSHDIIRYIFKPINTYGPNGEYKHGNSLLRTIQVMLAPIILDTDVNSPLKDYVYSFPMTQSIVYHTAVQRPILTGFNGLEIDMDWVLHQLNFWKYHMLREEECTLFGAYHSLTEGEQPGFHTSPLTNDGPPSIGKHWKGAYSFVHHEDIDEVRAGRNESQQIQDEFNSDEQTGDLQDMTLELSEESKETTWNPVFEEILGSLKQPVSVARTRAQRRNSPPASFFCQQRSFRFGGSGSDAEEDFQADGWFNQLPPQNGIPGWQRMTMMKYYINEFGEIDFNSLWAHGGVVLPGGKIIIGRWWSPISMTTGEMYSGPFILWCADKVHE